MKCTNCGNTVPDHRRDCPSCGQDNGFPNVRLANSSEEKKALVARYQDARASAKARGVTKELDEFEAELATSRMAISRPLTLILQLVDNERVSYVSFQRQVEAHALDPDTNIFDKVRVQYEEALYPHFSKEIIFGSLTLRDRGIRSYGPYCMIVKTEMIQKRASVFEENPHKFINHHRLLGNEPITPGYRADWDHRPMVAVAKLQPDISPGMTKADFPDVLQKDFGGTDEADFVEVHVYGSINRNAIDTVVGPKPKVHHDRIIWKAASERMTKLGIAVVTE